MKTFNKLGPSVFRMFVILNVVSCGSNSSTESTIAGTQYLDLTLGQAAHLVIGKSDFTSSGVGLSAS